MRGDRHHRRAIGGAVPRSGGGGSEPFSPISFVLPFDAPSGAVALSSDDDDVVRGGIRGLLVKKQAAILTFVVAHDVHPILRELHP
jgi:hypothetical protein